MDASGFVSFLFLVLAPALYFGSRLREWIRPPIRRAGLIALAGLALLRLPFPGLSFEMKDDLKIFFTGGLALLLGLQHANLGPLAAPRSRRIVLVLAGVVALLLHVNFFAFPGGFMHVHDFAHYYLGARYFPELGYGSLYDALLQAEEDTTGRVSVGSVRDLETNRLVSPQSRRDASRAVRDRFSQGRWQSFQKDAAYFRARLGEAYPELLVDHGFNPTPFWAAFGGTIASFVEPGDEAALGALSLLDPLLEIAAFAAIGWAFGVETLVLAFVCYSCLLGAQFFWVGGSYLRKVWISTLLLAVACLRRDRYRTAGALMAVSTLVRVFPVFFGLGVLFRGFWLFRREGRLPPHLTRFASSWMVTGGLLFAVTLVLPGGFGSWLDFRANITHHMSGTATNFIGLTNWIAFGAGWGPEGGPAELLEWRNVVYGWQRIVLLPVALGVVFWLSRVVDEVSATGLGILVTLVGLNLASYYYVFLALLVLAARDQPRLLAVVFATEAAIFALRLFESRPFSLMAYESLLLLLLWLAVYLDPILEAAGWKPSSRTGAGSSPRPG